jgi:hypothetical protein
MDWKLFTYGVYVLLSVVLTIWVGRTLHRNGRVFLLDVLEGNADLADSVNHLLVVGFYLVNLGFVSLALTAESSGLTATGAVELLSRKIGMVLLVLGALHLGNVFVLSRMRRRRINSSGHQRRVPGWPGHPGWPIPATGAGAADAGPAAP